MSGLVFFTSHSFRFQQRFLVLFATSLFLYSCCFLSSLVFASFFIRAQSVFLWVNGIQAGNTGMQLGMSSSMPAANSSMGIPLHCAAKSGEVGP